MIKKAAAASGRRPQDAICNFHLDSLSTLSDRVGGVERSLSAYQERLEAFMTRAGESLDRQEDALYGNGRDGLLTRIDRLEQSSAQAAQRSAEARELVRSTTSKVLAALVVEVLLFLAGLAWVGAQVTAAMPPSTP